MRRVVFDLETEPFSGAFVRAASYPERLEHAPRVRLGCAYLEDLDEYRFYAPEKGGELISLLAGADEVVSFNGNRFDLLVLARHHALSGPVPRASGGIHVDLCELLSEEVGFNVSLDLLARLNLGEGKHTKGREMEALDLGGLKQACRSDVRQTYELWRLWRRGEILLPVGTRASRPDPAEFLGPGPGEHMPKSCPNCGAVGALEFVEEPEGNLQEATDGQLSDYEAGLWGSATCARCGAEANYGF